MKVTALNQTTPDARFSGCAQVSLSYDYRPSVPLASGTTLLGIADYSGAYKHFWKPSIGWVYWTESETAPQWDLNSLPAGTETNPTRTFALGSYNMNYDNG